MRGLFPALAILLMVPARAELRHESSFARHLEYLASDQLRGRGNDQPELLEAASYIAAQFERIGLLPAGGEDSYFQPFTVTTAVELGERSECSFYSRPGSPVPLTYGTDYTALGFGAEGEVNGPLVFAGFGISAPEVNYDDYASIDVTGKVVIVFEHEPGELRSDSPFDGINPTFHSSVLKKEEAARNRGAIGLILIPDRLNHSRGERRRWKTPGRLESAGIPVLRLSRDWSERLWVASGRDVSDVWKRVDRRMTPASFDLDDLWVRIRLDVRRTDHQVNNVAGLLPGPGTGVVIAGAHYDHLGTGEGDGRAEVHNGADDNASGVAALLQLAEDLASEPRRHGVLFLAFAAEELGLLGSAHYLREPAVPLDETLCMLNFDMVGRSQGELLIGGVGTSPDFAPILEELALETPLSLRLAETASGMSDHLSFSRAGVPVLFFFSGLHADYHRPTDDFERIDLDRGEQIVDVARGFVLALNEAEVVSRRPELRPFETSSPSSDRELWFGPFFGGLVEPSYDGTGVRFSGVLAGSPARLAGLRPGDILVRFDGVPVASNYEFTRELRKHRPGEQVKVVVIRDQIKRELSVRLAHRSRMKRRPTGSNRTTQGPPARGDVTGS